MDRTPTPVKVVHLITLLEFGGAQGNTIHTVQNLNPSRFEAHLWCGRGGYWDSDVISSLKSEKRLHFFPRLVRQISPLNDLLVIFDLVRALKKLRPGIIHTHSSKAGIVGRMAARIARVPIVIHTFHGFGFNDQQKPWTRALFIFIERWVAQFSNKLIFVSKANQETARKLQIGDMSQHVVIRSGVRLKSMPESLSIVDKNKLKSDMGISFSDSIVVTIGPFKPQKNLVDFISMAERTLKSHPNVSFLIIGDGLLRPGLEAQINQRKLQGKVKLLGWRKDVPQLLSIVDVFVMTSLWEGLPRSLVEAMNVGVPPVCYETDGVRDLLNLEEGTMVRQRDLESLSENVLRLLTDKDHHLQISRIVRKRIGSEFDIDEMVRTQEDLYRSLLTVDNPTRIH